MALVLRLFNFVHRLEDLGTGGPRRENDRRESMRSDRWLARCIRELADVVLEITYYVAMREWSSSGLPQREVNEQCRHVEMTSTIGEKAERLMGSTLRATPERISRSVISPALPSSCR